MANGWGGSRQGAGKPRGAKRRITEEAIERAADGETPLEYMLRIMRDTQQADDRRDKMAIAAASYMHPKAIEVTGEDGGPIEFEGIAREIVRAHPPTDR